MPANLSQQYRNAEKQYRRASTPLEELACLELMLREIPKHKGTDKLQADLKKRISQTRTRLSNQSSRKSAQGFRMPRQGAARVVIVGPINSGKSQLFNLLAGAETLVADYPFSTTQPQPALMDLNDVKIQLIDTPPVTADDFDPRTESLIRGADLVLLLINAGDDEGADRFAGLIRNIQGSRSRLALNHHLDESDIGVTYTRSLLVWTGADDPSHENRRNFFKEYLGNLLADEFLPGVSVSATTGTGMDGLKSILFERLDLVRVFTKSKNQDADDLTDPIALPNGSTMLDLAESLHQELAANFHQARIWGKGKHDGTVVTGDYVLEDQDIVEIKTR